MASMGTTDGRGREGREISPLPPRNSPLHLRPLSPMTAPTTDWITLGECEFREGSAEIDPYAIRTALLPHQPRRCLMRPVVLCSNNTKSSRFITPTGLSSMPHYVLPQNEKPSEPTNPCTDFVLSGLAAEGPSGVSLDAIRDALLPADFPRAPVSLGSNNAKTSHWVSNGLCSTAFTNQDFLWMENTAKLEPGWCAVPLSLPRTPAPPVPLSAESREGIFTLLRAGSPQAIKRPPSPKLPCACATNVCTALPSLSR